MIRGNGKTLSTGIAISKSLGRYLLNRVRCMNGLMFFGGNGVKSSMACFLVALFFLLACATDDIDEEERKVPIVPG